MHILPSALCEKMRLPLETSVEAFFSFMNEGTIDPFDGLLSLESSRAAALESLQTKGDYKICLLKQTSQKQHKYCTLTSNSGDAPALIGLFGEDISSSIATDLENLVFWMILDDDLLSKIGWGGQNSDDFFLRWRDALTGAAIVAIPENKYYEKKLQLIAAMFGLSYAALSLPTPPLPLLSGASNLCLSSNIDEYTLTKSRLLFEAATIVHPKWRCLSLYRILENAYLSQIKQALMSDFDADASKAVDVAQKNLSSELNQLVNLAETLDLKTEFIDFNNEIESLKSSFNQFIIKLDKGAEEDSLYKSKPDAIYKKAVLRFYKLRCAIAHAGTSSVIYEQFPDSNRAALRLIPLIEKIILKSLGIVVVP